MLILSGMLQVNRVKIGIKIFSMKKVKTGYIHIFNVFKSTYKIDQVSGFKTSCTVLRRGNA